MQSVKDHLYVFIGNAGQARQAVAADSTSSFLFLQYGTVVFWGINAAEEQGIVHAVINPCKVEPLELSEVEIDEFEFVYSLLEPPHIQNDVITINKGFAADHQVR
jgi:uncharacterized Rmd1/YagE family protein